MEVKKEKTYLCNKCQETLRTKWDPPEEWCTHDPRGKHDWRLVDNDNG